MAIHRAHKMWWRAVMASVVWLGAARATEIRIVEPDARHAWDRFMAEVLREELARRVGDQVSIGPPISTNARGKDIVQIGLWSGPRTPRWAARAYQARKGDIFPENRPEGFRILAKSSPGSQNDIWIHGGDKRGLLFGIGYVIRKLSWSPEGDKFGFEHLAATGDIASSPAYPIRGHQLGYRNRANSWDGWTPEQFDQHIRELSLFGTNCIENIPFEDNTPSPHMLMSRDAMNVKLSEICERYDLDYWVWTPADFDLRDESMRTAQLERHEALYKACPRLDGVFFPGGDPGNNHPSLVMPYLKAISERLRRHHPKAGVWLSLQGFNREEADFVFNYLEREQPEWFTGIVSGPSSPPIELTRKRLPARYRHRHYPDITHTVRCQYPVPWWDPAFALTLGRECPNPRPVFYAHIHNWFAPYTDGFLTYSDGVHDDVNKIVWSMRGWDPNADVREILVDYTRCFFGEPLAEDAADGILALEKNWEGAIGTNASIDATYAYWSGLNDRAGRIRHDWRWMLCVLRATYDAYTRDRQLKEAMLEDEANARLLEAGDAGPDAAINAARKALDRSAGDPALRARIEDLCQRLFESIRLQTSVEKYHASGAERGCVLDFVDYPLNNRWWLEDEFEKVKAMPSREAQIARLKEIAMWERPGPGSYYDDIGNPGKSWRVVRGERINTDPLQQNDPNPGHVWWDNGRSRARLSWQSYLDWPLAVKYQALDPNGTYVLRMTGQGEALTKIDGNRVPATLYGKETGTIKAFDVPPETLEDGELIVTWDVPDERHLNWRQRSRINEIWLVRQE